MVEPLSGRNGSDLLLCCDGRRYSEVQGRKGPLRCRSVWRLCPSKVGLGGTVRLGTGRGLDLFAAEDKRNVLMKALGNMKKTKLIKACRDRGW